MTEQTIPRADQINTQVEKLNTQDSRELTEEEKKIKEQNRTQMVLKCRDYVHNYIEKKAPGKIRYRSNVLKMNNSYVFRFAPPAKRGQRTRFFSQVVIDRNTGDCRLEYFRPRRHDQNLWYFPIYYMMNGVTKNPARTFESLGIVPVNDSIKKVFEDLGYRVSFEYTRKIGM